MSDRGFNPRFKELPKSRSVPAAQYMLQSELAHRMMAGIVAKLIETGIYEVNGDVVTVHADYRGADIDYTPLELRAAAHMMYDAKPGPIDRVSDAWYEGFELGTEEGQAIHDWCHPSGKSRDGVAPEQAWSGTSAAEYARNLPGGDYKELTEAFAEGFQAGIEDVLQSPRHSPGSPPNGPLGGDYYWNNSSTIKTSRERRRAAPADAPPAAEPVDIYTAATRALSGGW